MARTIQFGGKSHSFPDDATDDEIASVLEESEATGSAPPPPTDLSKLPSDEAIQNLVNPAPTSTLGQIGAGVQNHLGKWALGARQMVDQGIHTASEATTPGSLGKILQGIGVVPPPGSTEYDPGEYAQIRKQLDSRTPTEAVAQGATGIAGALAMAGPVGTTALGTGLMSGLESGDAEEGAKAGLLTAIAGPLMAKGVQYTAAIKFKHIQSILRAAKMATGGALGASIGGPAGGAIGAVLGSLGASARSSRKLYNYITNDQINKASRLLWSLLPPAISSATADSTTQPSYDTTEKLMNADSPKALDDLARRRRQAQTVLK